jgi:hypothetical protein
MYMMHWRYNSTYLNWALHASEFSPSHIRRSAPAGKSHRCVLNRRLGGHQNRSARFGEEVQLLPLPEVNPRFGEEVQPLPLSEVNPRFLGHPRRSVVTVSSEIFWLYLCLFGSVDVGFHPRSRSYSVSEEHVHPPVDAYGVYGFSKKYGLVLLHDVEL